MKNRGMLAALAAGALSLVAAVLLVSSASAASGIALTPASATVAPGGSVKVNFTITPGTGETVAGFTGTVNYDEAKLTATACTPSALCNLTFAAGQVGFSPFDAGGIASNDVSVTFTAGTTVGNADLGLTLSACKNELAANLTCNATGTTISIAVPATAAPTNSPAPATATPTKAPTTLPSTGGTPGADSSNSIAWLLAVSGLAIVAGGAWAVAHARREN